MSIRLKTLAGYYHHSHSVWDIGCDHGLLGLSFAKDSEVKEIHLVDPSPDVIRVLHNKLIDSYITIPDSIKIHKQRGQEVTLNSSSKTIFIAGMGGKEIAEIIQHLIPQMTEHDRLVISPHRTILELRATLHKSELGLVSEISLKEDGQFYQILCLEKNSNLPKANLYGENVWKGVVGEEYRNHMIRAYEFHQDPLSRAFLTYLRGLI